MADARINALTEDTALVDTDWLVVEVGDSEARKVSVETLRTAMAGVIFKDYAQFTSNVVCSATSAAAANTIVTGNSVTYDGSEAILVVFCTSGYACSTTANSAHLEIYDGSTDLSMFYTTRADNTIINSGFTVAARFVPSAAAHTYSVRGWIETSGTFTVVGDAGGAGTPSPGFMLILGLG